jgi:hypothetical protein
MQKSKIQKLHQDILNKLDLLMQIMLIFTVVIRVSSIYSPLVLLVIRSFKISLTASLH